MKFLHDVFIGDRDVVLNDKVPQFTAPTYPELSVKHIFDRMSDDTEFMRYFDTERVDKGKYPERNFFWGILLTTKRELAETMINEVLNNRLQNGDKTLQ